MAIGIGASGFLARAERDGAFGRATKAALDQAEVLFAMLTPRQFSQPVTGHHSTKLELHAELEKITAGSADR